MQLTSELLAARRYLTNVLLHLSVDAEHMSVLTLLRTLDYFAENPQEYIHFTDDQREETTTSG